MAEHPAMRVQMVSEGIMPPGERALILAYASELSNERKSGCLSERLLLPLHYGLEYADSVSNSGVMICRLPRDSRGGSCAVAADTSGDVGWPSLLTSASARRRTAEWDQCACSEETSE
ncbi:hypothetical protein Q8A67_012261 [Cirrhinus molitorella]|uniref:Uncharacterized protein n=1 Tax=Cirrhinus molitorella TaxID=172907 RepID=A0AA88PPQ0_9TELE|nr:hypothetical protein Q8A67_012261 [Cirrhinus molitorella]